LWRCLLRDYSDGRCRSGSCRFQFLACGVFEWPARSRRQLLLLRGKADRCRRRRGARDDRPLEHARRRLVALGGGATHASLRRRDRRHKCHLPVDSHLARHLHGCPRHRLRLHEGRGRHGDDRTRDLLVCVHDVGDVRVVVVVIDDRGVDHRVAAIDVLEIAAACRVGRPIDVARSERKPRHATDVAGPDRERKVAAADERDQRRRVVRPGAHGAWYPTPATTEIRPATVMGHGETPRGVIDPGPTPRVDPGPMAVSVRCPAGRHARGVPDVAVGRIGAPRAVRIEVLIADDVRRYVTGGDRRVVSAVAIGRPAIEFVDANVGKLVVAQSGPGKAIWLARINDICGAFAVGLALASAYDDRRRVALGIYFDPVFAGLPEGEREIRRIDFEHLVRIESTNADIQRTLRQLQLGDAVVEIENGYAGAGVHANHGAADLYFGPCTRIGPQAVASGERPIDRRLYPIVLAGRRETHGAGHVAEARDARRRVGAGPAADGKERNTCHEGECSKIKNFYAHKDALRVSALFALKGVP